MAAPKNNKFAAGNKGGRPTKLTAEIVALADSYLEWVEAHPLAIDEVRDTDGVITGHKTRPRLPSLDGLCVFIGISQRTLTRWLESEEDKEFCRALGEIVELVKTTQSKVNIENSAAKQFDPSFGKLVQAQHGWRDKVDVTSDGKALPQPLLNILEPEAEKKP